MSRVLCVAIFFICVLTVLSVSPAWSDVGEINQRPRIGLVLGGGGAKGLAHVGVLKALEQYRVPIDAIAGTSMGAIIGALYASGKRPDEIEAIARSIDWVTIFSDETERRRINFRRKQEDFGFLMDFKLSFQDGKLILPKGLIQGQKLFLVLAEHLAAARTISSFDDLPIPFRAVAADLETGDAVVLKDGDLATAVFASMAIPGAVPPAEREGRVLVDGGIVNNLPMDVARSMGVDILIVVDITSRLRTRDELDSFVDVLGQMNLLLTSQNTKRQLGTLRDRDILVNPELRGMTAASFDRALSAIEPGYTAAASWSVQLRALGLMESEWHQHLTRRTEKGAEAPRVDFVRIEQDSPISDDVVSGFIRVRPGELLDTQELNEDIEDLYGLDMFERISYSILTENGRTGLIVQASENKTRRSYLRFGLLLETDFDTDTNILLGTSYTKRNINRFGGEWRSVAQIGSDLLLGSEFYQPFGSRLNYFVNPIALLIRGDSLIFENTKTPIAETRVSAAELGIDVGTQLNRWGELRVGGHRAWGDIKPRIGDPGFDKVTFDDSFYLVRLDVDTLDRLSFPQSGAFIRAQWVDHVRALGGDFSFQEFELKGFMAKTWGRDTLQLAGKFQTTKNANDGSLAGFDLGGFLNLSGFSPNQLFGSHVAYGQAVYYRRLNERGMFLDIPVYAGGSIEAGDVYDDLDDITFDSLIWAGSIFLGVDSFFGPVYLAGGYAEGGNSSVYLFVGQTF